MKIRSIHPEFFTDTKIAQLSPHARIFYIGLWCVADDYGRGRLIPKTLEGQVFPHDIVDINHLVYELEKRQFIRRYEIDGEQFFQVRKWDSWQKPRYQGKTNIPEPTDDSWVDAESFGASRNLFQLSEKRAVGEGEGEGEGEGAAASNTFQVFHSRRARDEVKKKAAAGYPVKTESGLAIRIAGDPEFVAESKRIWGHRECGKCAGSGYTSVYAPGSGTVQAECTEVIE